MRRILEREQTGPAGLLLRLAWLQGLSRDEIAALTWDQADLEAAVLRLPDRMVPLCPEMCAFLRRLRGAQGETPRVLVSERTGGAVPPESISRLARKALDREGQTAVRLMDLRHDWIIRQLAELDWPAVARVSGVAVPALQARFAAYAPSKRPARAEEKPLVDEFQLWKVLQAERDTPAGLALWLAWQMGLQAQEIAALTWDQVDLAANALRLPDREVLLTNAVRRLLQDAWDARVPGDDPHVLLTVRSRRPVDLARLSRMTRAALIRGGMDRVLLRDLRRDEGRESEETAILDLVRGRGSVARGDVMEALALSHTTAHNRLRRLTEEGRLVRVGGKYYLPGTVVPPERQGEVIRSYLAQAGFAYRQDLAELLHIRPKQCYQVLRRMVAAGELVQTGQKYRLPSPEKPLRKIE